MQGRERARQQPRGRGSNRDPDDGDNHAVVKDQTLNLTRGGAERGANAELPPASADRIAEHAEKSACRGEDGDAGKRKPQARCRARSGQLFEICVLERADLDDTYGRMCPDELLPHVRRLRTADTATNTHHGELPRR